MCKLKLTIDTKDRDALEAVSDLCLTLANRIADPVRDNVVPLYPTLDKIDDSYPEAEAGVEPPPEAHKVYDVDGRQYTAVGIRAGGFSIEQLYAAGLDPQQIGDIFESPVSLIESCVDAALDDAIAARMQDTPEPVPEPEPRTTGVELDSADMPWDMRIHSGSKSKVSDGTWRKKKGVDKAIVEEVEAELVALMSAGAPPQVVQTADGQIAPPPQVEQTNVVPPPPATQTPAADVSGAMTFPQFLKACSLKINGGDGVTMDQILSVLNRHGVASLQLVRNREDLIPQIWAEIDAGQFDE